MTPRQFISCFCKTLRSDDNEGRRRHSNAAAQSAPIRPLQGVTITMWLRGPARWKSLRNQTELHLSRIERCFLGCADVTQSLASQAELFAGTGRQQLYVAGQQSAKLVRMTGKGRAWRWRLCAGSVVTGNAPLRPEQLQCDDRSSRVHGEVSADRQDGNVRFVHAPDQLHVAEDAGVAGEIELKPVLQLDHAAARRAAVAAIGRAA